MVYGITAYSVSQALANGLRLARDHGYAEQSRNGPVMVVDSPVITEYVNPHQRVLFSPVRDANPFFHLMEALWMLGGRNDLAFPLFFNSKFGSYSDDGNSVWGAYGWRWRGFFGYDQLGRIVHELKTNPKSRRAVLAMWNASMNGGNVEAKQITPLGGERPITSDLHVGMSGGKDVPCNTHAYFEIRKGALDMTVCCRSNDILWGAYGANAVHFSMLMEFMAAAIGVPMGRYRQFSNNLHLYTGIMEVHEIEAMAVDAESTDLYTTLEGAWESKWTMPMVNVDLDDWQRELTMFLEHPKFGHGYEDPFFSGVASPMYRAYAAWKEDKDYDAAFSAMATVEAADWRRAGVDWLVRRADKATLKLGDKMRVVDIKDGKAVSNE